MDKASASGAGDSRFESWAGHFCIATSHMYVLAFCRHTLGLVQGAKLRPALLGVAGVGDGSHNCRQHGCTYTDSGVAEMKLICSVNTWPYGLMDKALVLGTKDSRFES